MKQKPLSIADFNERFPTDDACLAHLMRLRYGERLTCFKCLCDSRYYRVKTRRAYECEHCGYQVYPTAGTPFEQTRTSLRDWFYVMFLFCASRNGVAAKEVERQLGVTYKTAWRMCRLIRIYMGAVDGDAPLGGPTSDRGVVEIDKAFIGGKDKQGADDKKVVLGMAERGGEIVTRVIPDKTTQHIKPVVTKFVREGSFVATDTALAFKFLRDYGYVHGTVDHSKKEYVRGDVHTNTIEAFWANFKRGVAGTYVHVSSKHLQAYLREFEYRHNLRRQPALMFELLVSAFSRVRLATSR
ncbi:MAG: IS1595 family transposase [Xanthobacteraceae bacterium]